LTLLRPKDKAVPTRQTADPSDPDHVSVFSRLADPKNYTASSKAKMAVYKDTPSQIPVPVSPMRAGEISVVSVFRIHAV
jgi:hypothetical protein